MKSQLTTSLVGGVIASVCCFAALLCSSVIFAQCKPSIEIDGNLTVVDPTDPFGLELPMWMGEGQTLAAGPSVNSISVIEFTVNGAALEFGGVLSITSTTATSVPTGKVWKVESVVKKNTPSNYRSVSYTIPGTYTFTVPACAREICIEAWGGGGGGSAAPNNAGSGSGGGGAGYGAGCYAVTPSSNLTVVVGAGGAGGTAAAQASGQTGQTSSVGSLITAEGGGGSVGSSSGGTGGAGGSSTGIHVVQGGPGFVGGGSCDTPSGRGGAAGNGGAGGNPVISGQAGQAGSAPGGGGSGGGSGNCGGWRGGGAGGAGRVIITW